MDTRSKPAEGAGAMDERGAASPLAMILVVAAVLVGVVFFFLGQLGFALVAIALAVIVGVAVMFSRAKTPTD
ncbi:MAG TPA: hypothetical protein VFQ45_08695 [Longimicrobium sp.]|nr:hypothetical protein [Longimicrobium sp.]